MNISITLPMPLFEEWFDNLDDAPHNINETEPKKQIKSKPFEYLYNIENIILCKDNNDFYIIDLDILNELELDVMREIALDYIELPYTPNTNEVDFERANILSLKDIEPEYIVSYINHNLSNISVGIGEDDWNNNKYFIIKIDDNLKSYLIEHFSDHKLNDLFIN